MEDLNDFFAPSEEYAWTNPASFHPNYRPESLAFTQGVSEQPLLANTFATSAPETTSNHASGAGGSQGGRPNAPRARHKAIPWDLHQEELRKLYLIDKMKLEDIRDKMRRERLFEATYVSMWTGLSQQLTMLQIETVQGSFQDMGLAEESAS
jgi:hypothetical protein